MQVSSLASSLVIFLKYGVLFGVIISLVALILTLGLWWYTVIMEAMAGNHSYTMTSAIKFAFMLFIFSEVMFFVGVFWCYFDSALSPSMAIGCVWPAFGIYPISPYGIPLLNTVLLLSSGVSLTWAHSALLLKENALPAMSVTIVYAAGFEFCQYLEYSTSTFSMSDSIYGSVFYFSTGFHGLHVIVGHVFLAVNTVRIYLCHFSRTHHVGFECAIVYWHFVDVVWLFLYVFVYWWPY